MSKVRLGDACVIQNGFAFDSKRFSPTAGVPLIRIRDLKTNDPSLRYDGPFDGAYVIKAGDLLIGMDGEFKAYRWAGPPSLLNQRVCRLIPDSSVLDAEFLHLVLDGHLREIEAETSLTTVKHLSSRTVAGIKLDLPPLETQRVLAVRLAAQLAGVAASGRACRERRSDLDILRAFVYRRAFEMIVPLTVERSHQTEPNDWSWVHLTDIARLESGHTPSRDRADWWGGDTPWIALPDIRALDGMVAFETGETTNAEGIAHSSARVLPAGTVVMSRTASVGFVTRMGRPMATSQDFVNWVCGPDLDPEFLMHLLIRSRPYVRELSSGAIHKTVYMPTVKAFKVCVPSIKKQRRIVSELVAQLDALALASRALETQVDAIMLLPGALLRKTFQSPAGP